MTQGLVVYSGDGDDIFDSNSMPYRFTHRGITPTLLSVVYQGRTVTGYGVALVGASRYALVSADMRGATVRVLSGAVIAWVGGVHLVRHETSGVLYAMLFADVGNSGEVSGYTYVVSSTGFARAVTLPKLYVIDRVPSGQVGDYGLNVYDETGRLTLSSEDQLPNVVEVKTVTSTATAVTPVSNLLFVQGPPPHELSIAYGGDEFNFYGVYVSGTNYAIRAYEVWFEWVGDGGGTRSKLVARPFTVIICEIPQ